MRILLIILGLALAACGGDDRREDTVGREIADDMNRQLDEARAVEGQLEAGKARLDAAIDESEEGGSDP